MVLAKQPSALIPAKRMSGYQPTIFWKCLMLLKKMTGFKLRSMMEMPLTLKLRSRHFSIVAFAQHFLYWLDGSVKWASSMLQIYENSSVMGWKLDLMGCCTDHGGT